MARAGKKKSAVKTVLVVTGSRSEFGLLRPVMDAVRKAKDLRLRVAVAGEHLLGPAHTWKEVAAAYSVDARVPMQSRSDKGRLDHAAATARGMAGFAKAFKKLKPDWVVVLGDRIEAFAAASAASIAGIAVCHIHGGDRAEGIADEAMRHAITKLAHLHCAATKLSAKRIVQMGERKEHVHVTGSPAIDGLDKIKPMSDAEAKALGDPSVVVLLHPAGLADAEERAWARFTVITAVLVRAFQSSVLNAPLLNVLLLAPNHDPSRMHIDSAWQEAKALGANYLPHLPRSQFVAVLKRLAQIGGLLIGNSSAGLIESSAVGLTAVNLGSRQAGRERDKNVVDIVERTDKAMSEGVSKAIAHSVSKDIFESELGVMFGDGRAGPRIAALLAKVDSHDPALLRKRNSY